MKNLFKQILIGSTSVMLLSACNTVWNGAGDNPSVAERHPISVDSQVVTLTLDVDPSSSELSAVDKARIKAFAYSYLSSGHGPVTVTAPTGGADDNVGQETSADIRQYLYDLGVSYDSMTGASYRAGGSGADRQLVLSYTHYVASASPCGIWTDELKSKYKNVAHPNFGCADQNNLAAMLADPRDLIAPANGSPSDATSRVRAIEAFRDGTATANERDETIDATVVN